jgi:hypothetical protein
MRLSLWLGDLNAPGGAAANNLPERKLQLQDGVAVTWDLGKAMNNRSADKASASVQTMGPMQVVARLSGKSVRLEFYTPSTSASSISQGSATAASTLELPLAQWTDVTGKGPWNQQDTMVSAGGRNAARDSARVYLKAESESR